MEILKLQPIGEADRTWIAANTRTLWGAESIVAHGSLYYPHELPGWVAWMDDQRAGLLTCRYDADGCEIVTLNSLIEGRGVGAALIATALAAARAAGSPRLWLITTNDNLRAIRFYQKRGFHLVAIHPDAVTAARAIKPEIPHFGDDGIPIRDELELEIVLPLRSEA